MNRYLDGLGTIVRLELRQRIRSVAWVVLISIVFVLVVIVSVLLWFSLSAFGGDAASSGGVYSSIIFFVLLIGTLVAPAMSGNAINGDRDAGTLATTQVTLASTSQIVLGKFLAAWTVGLTFLAASLPSLAFAVIGGGVRLDTLLASFGMLVLELGVVAAVGVGLSGLIARPLFSVVTTYLVVAALSIGTLIVFGLGSLAAQSEVRVTSIEPDYAQADPETGLFDGPPTCITNEYTYTVPRTDQVWGFLAANPYVMLADAAPSSFDRNGTPLDLFGQIAFAARSAQVPVELERTDDYCTGDRYQGAFPEDYETPEEVIASTVPTWFVGLGLHLLLAAGLLLGAVRRTSTPAVRLARGSRIA